MLPSKPRAKRISDVSGKHRDRDGGAELDVRPYARFKLRDGKVIHVFEHQDRSEALLATGLAA
jgi:hypothetical protein